MATDYAKATRREKRKRKEAQQRVESERASVMFAQENQKRKKDKKNKKRGKNVDAATLCKHVNKWDATRLVRTPREFRAQSYNIEKNIDAFIRHCYIKYDMPKHLLSSFRSVDVTFDSWFFTVAGGGSFQKFTKEYFTKQEANIFLNYKGNLDKCSDIVWYAKLKSLGCSDSFINRIIRKCFSNRNYLATHNHEVVRSILHFFANFEHRLDNEDFNELGDYFNNLFANQHDFTFKGRTYSSVVLLSNEWHTHLRKAKIDRDVSWSPMFANYVFRDKDKQHHVRTFELTNNKELLAEGKTQRHCVYSYVSACERGSCAIFTMRFYHIYGGVNSMNEDRDYRITIEVNKSDRQIVQAKHKFNNQLSDNDLAYLRRFAGDRGFTIRDRYL